MTQSIVCSSNEEEKCLLERTANGLLQGSKVEVRVANNAECNRIELRPPDPAISSSLEMSDIFMSQR